MIDLTVFRLDSLFYRYFFRLILCLFVSQLNAAPEQTSIQLKWKHAFQFAGYYAAIEKGFYQDAGQRYQQSAEDFQRLGFAQSSRIEKQFFYHQAIWDSTLVKLTAKEQTWKNSILKFMWVVLRM